MEKIQSVPGAARELLRIHEYAQAGRTALEDVHRVAELILYIQVNGDAYWKEIHDAYIKQGFRLKAGDSVAVKDDNGNAVVRPLIGPASQQFRAR